MMKKLFILIVLFATFLGATSVNAKKQRFYNLVTPKILEVDLSLRKLYEKTKEDIKNNKDVSTLLKKYKTNDKEELLKRIKPHPVSITIAQAIIESGWGTSRFFKEGNNLFGIWSVSPNQERIKAKELRGGKKAIYVRKFKTIKDAIRTYYYTLATNKRYKKFREARYKTDNPYTIAKYLNNYSERKEIYTKELINIIRYNNLEKYDTISQKNFKEN